MHTTHVIIAILVVLLATGIFMWFTKPAAVKVVPVPMPSEKCDCSNQIDEAYDLGYTDGSNMTTIDADDAKETFYDYENTAGQGVKYEKSTGSAIVKKAGGLCPNATKEITSGKNKGKCERSAEWYKTYRGTDEKGRAFTCTGGRVSNGKQCVCDESSGKYWNGKKCMCRSDYYWDSKSKKCLKKGQFKDMLNKMPKPASKPSSKSCPRFQKWDGSKCVCDYAAGIMWDGKNCVCDYGRGYQWDGKNCVKKNDTRCPNGQYYDWTTARCKKP
jgi:hypothetical protein